MWSQKRSFWCLTNDSCAETFPTNPKGVTPCAVGVLLLCSWVSVFCWREQRKTCTHMWVLCRGRALAPYCFQQMGVRGDEGGCMHVCVCCWSVFFLCLSTSELPLHPSSVSDFSQDDRTHPSVYTFTLSLSVYQLPLSLCSSMTLYYLFLSLFFLSTFLPPLSGKPSHSLFFFVCWIHCNMGAQLWSLSAVYPSLLGSRTVTWQPVNPPDCVSASLSTLGSGLQKKTEMVKVKEVIKQILQVIWLASETCPTPLCYITASLSLKHTHSLHYLCRASYI